jgi:hypothetical protein
MGEQITYFQWDDSISLVSMGGQQITCFNGRTTDRLFQWDDNRSLFTMGWHQIICFKYAVLPLKQVKCCHPIEAYDLMSSHGNLWSVVISLKQVICCPPIETCDLLSSHWNKTKYHFLQWDDNISPVSMGWQQITFFNGMTTDRLLQWENRSLIFNGMTAFHLIETSEMLSSHWSIWSDVIPL